MTTLLYRINRSTPLLAAALVGSAGLAVPAAAQYERQSDRQAERSETRSAEDNKADHRVFALQRLSEVLGSEVDSRDGETVATIDDLVIDRGSGKVTHVVTIANDILGFGGDRVAIPYDAFRFNVTEKRLTLDLTKRQIDDFESMLPRTWVRIESGDLASSLGMLRTAQTDNALTTEPAWARHMRSNAETREITGTLASIDRKAMADGTEVVVLGVRDDESGEVHRVVTGPSWFVMNGDSGLERKSDVTITAVRVSGTSDFDLAARTVETDGGTMDLWPEGGKAAWLTTDRASDRSGLITANELAGMDVSSRDDSAGEIDDAVIEFGSGTIAMMLLDPDENLFGIGDELKCVPWSVASVGADEVRIDASTEMLEKCPSAPDDLTLISTPATLRPMYEVVEVRVVEFQPRDAAGDRESSMKDNRDKNRGG